MSLKIYDQHDFEVPKNSEQSSNLKFIQGLFTITDIKQAVKNQNRANIFINGKYQLSLDIFQLTSLNVKIGQVYTKEELFELERQSEFGKLYALAINYCLMRPHSEKEVRDYLWKKTLTKKLRNKKTGEIYEKKGVSKESVDQVLLRLIDKKYIDDEKFTRFWVENRNLRRGSSLRKIKSELLAKGVDHLLIDNILAETSRNDSEEIRKIIAKKANRYSDRQKLIAYLVRQGFSFDEITSAVDEYLNRYKN